MIEEDRCSTIKAAEETKHDHKIIKFQILYNVLIKCIISGECTPDVTP